MPRKHPLPEREQKICARLMEFRRGLKLSRATFARQIGVNRFSLANVEAGRAAVRFDLAWRIKEKFHMSLVWLFKEQGNMTGNYAVSANCVPTPTMLFSKAYELYVGQALIDTRAVQQARGMDEARLATVTKGSVLSESEVDSIFEESKLEVPERCWAGYRLSLMAFSKDVAKLLTGNMLTDSETTDKTFPVKAQLPSLLERLKKATGETGKKSELAEFLARATKANVPLASVSRWLSGEREPGGEVALQMLKWVELQERK